MTPAVRTGLLVLGIAWAFIAAIVVMLHQIEPTRLPALVPASSSPLPQRVELGAVLASKGTP